MPQLKSIQPAMNLQDNSGTNSDNLEFIDDLDEHLSAEEESGEALFSEDRSTLPESKKNILRKKARNSALSLKQAYFFMSYVELDLLRKPDEQLGLERLFDLYCAKGNKAWLNPVPYLNKIDEVLLRYAGKGLRRSEAFKPFIDLLIRLAENNINSTAFLKYIMVTRLARDNNWRKWIPNHFRSLELIADLLISMYGNTPFDQPVIGGENNRLSRDIVLVKYVGQPLALFPGDMLADSGLMRRYMQAWCDLNLDSSFVIIFMKTNILHFMYAMSGRIDFQQLILIVEQMPEIESGFRENFPPDIFTIDLKKIDLNLFDYDIDASLNSRRDKGYKFYDFVTEIKAYLKIIIALLNTNSGIYLCGFFARKLTMAKDPVIAVSLAKLVSILNDRGGKHIFIWHTIRLLKRNKIEHPAYLELIENNGGFDPDYPNLLDIFDTPDLTKKDRQNILESAEELKLPLKELLQEALKRQGKRNASEVNIGRMLRNEEFIDQINYIDLINVYVKHYPDSAEIIRNYQNDFIEGQDRDWDLKYTVAIDSLGLGLHYALLKLVIRGLGTGFHQPGPQKSGSFTGLYKEYSPLLDREYEKDNITFTMPVKEIKNVGKIKEAEIRKRINTGIIKDLWAGFGISDEPVVNILPFLNELSMRLNEPVRDARQLVLDLERDLENNPDDKKILKRLESSRKTLSVIGRQKDDLEKTMEIFPELDDIQKLVLGIIVAGKNSRKFDNFCGFLFKYLFNRYSQNREIAARLEILRTDIEIDMITYQQFTYIINTLDTLLYEITQDPELQTAIKEKNELSNDMTAALKPYFITASDALNQETLEASIKSIMFYNKLNSIRSKWLDLLGKDFDGDDKYFRKYSLYYSRTPMDTYYGDMGATCLSLMPLGIFENERLNIRLVSNNDRQIIGMGVVSRSGKRIEVSGAESNFWHVFAINPLHSVLSGLTQRQQLLLYLQYRLLFEKLSKEKNEPIVLAGISTYGTLSNDKAFSDLIIGLEKKLGSVPVNDAYGLDLYYTESQFAKGMLIINPKNEKTYIAERLIERMNM